MQRPGVGRIILLFFHRVVPGKSLFMVFWGIYRAHNLRKSPTDRRNPGCGSGVKTPGREMRRLFYLIVGSVNSPFVRGANETVWEHFETVRNRIDKRPSLR